jgi:hypothetical protein
MGEMGGVGTVGEASREAAITGLDPAELKVELMCACVCVIVLSGVGLCVWCAVVVRRPSRGLTLLS